MHNTSIWLLWVGHWRCIDLFGGPDRSSWQCNVHLDLFKKKSSSNFSQSPPCSSYFWSGELSRFWFVFKQINLIILLSDLCCLFSTPLCFSKVLAWVWSIGPDSLHAVCHPNCTNRINGQHLLHNCIDHWKVHHSMSSILAKEVICQNLHLHWKWDKVCIIDLFLWSRNNIMFRNL